MCKRDQYTAARNAYEQLWPNYCRTCGGLGEIYVEDYECGDFTDPCSCVEQGKCPRCGSQVFGEEETDTCSHCKWEYGETEGCPTDACWCAECAPEMYIDHTLAY